MNNNRINDNKFFKESYHRKHWEIFFNNFISKDNKILDFGCGAGWGIKIGREKGFDIFGLDTVAIHKKRVEQFDKFRKKLGIHEYVKLYNGAGRLPFEDNSFSLIVCRASFNKFRNKDGQTDENELALERLDEFSRILYDPRIVVITGKYFKKQFSKFDFKVYNWSKIGITKIWNDSGSTKITQEKASI